MLALTVTGWLAAGVSLADAPPAEPPAATGEAGAAAEEQHPPAASASDKPPASATGADAAAAKAPEPGSCNPAIDTCLVAETQGRDKGHIWARGFADMRMGDVRVQADAIDIYDVEHDGVTRQRLTAEGNVVLMQKQDRLTGTKLSMDLDSGRGMMDNVVGYSDPGVFFTATQVERIDPKTYRILGGRFTSCCQPKPRWSFWAPRATLKIEDHITATAAHFDLGVPLTGQQLPFLFLPYFVYPVKPDGRATGVLFPSFNVDFNRGVDVRVGFFLTMGRSADQTFGFERRASPAPLPGQPAGTLAPKLIHDLRWVSDPRSYGDLHTALFPPSDVSAIQGQAANKHWDWSLDWHAQQAVDGLFTAKLLANVTSPQDYLTPVTQIYNSNSRMALSLQRVFGRQMIQLQVDNRESVFSEFQSNTRRFLPRIVLSQASRAIGHTGLRWEYSARLDHLNLVKKVPDTTDNPDGTQTTVSTQTSDAWWRFDVAPSVSRPIAVSFLSVTPRLTARYTHYGESCPPERLDCGKNFTGGPLTRRYVEGSVEILGPQFSRVFGGPAGFSDLIKHVIGPEFTWVYRRATDNFDLIPRFGDETDNTAATHELRYGLVQHLLGRRKLPSGGTRPFEFLTWEIYQKHYFWAPQTPFDSSFNTPLWDQVSAVHPEYQRSPVRSSLKFTPAPAFSFNWLEEYDVNRKKTTRLDLGTDVRGRLGKLHVTWSRSPARYDEDGTETFPEQNDLSGTLDLLTGESWLQLGGSGDYSFVQNNYYAKGFIARSVHARFDFQCLALMVQYTQRKLYGLDKYTNSFQFSIELAHLGSFGMGPGGMSSGGGMGIGGLR